MKLQWPRFLPCIIISQCLIWLTLYYFPFQVQWFWETHTLAVYPTNSTSLSDVEVVPLPTRPAIVSPRVGDANLDWLDQLKDE